MSAFLLLEHMRREDERRREEDEERRRRVEAEDREWRERWPNVARARAGDDPVMMANCNISPVTVTENPPARRRRWWPF